jgi:predicted negative regulator of RcsB-dependent stress response
MQSVLLTALLTMPFASVSAQLPSADDIRRLDHEVQDVKTDALDLAAELNLLEQELLYPAATRVTVSLALGQDSDVELSAVELRIDGGLTARHVYSTRELEALQKGGVHRLYTGNVTAGPHELGVRITGKAADGTSFEKAGRHSFSKNVDAKSLAIRLDDSGFVLESEQPSYGEALYYAYQGMWFEALEQLRTEPERDAVLFQAIDANFSVGDFELNYRMHQRAARVIQAALREPVDESFHNHAAYRLARLHFRKGQKHDALRALDRISGDVPGEIREDVAFLRAGIYLALEWSEPAIPVLEKLLKSKEYGAFASYNLGIAYLQGDLTNAAYDRLDRAGRFKAKNEADAAIRDKANLVLGTLLHERGQYNRALVYLNRIRLDGPFSNRALLSAGWANMSGGRPNKAIVSWGVLAKRDATDRATQEAMLALPYAYGQMDLHSQAAAHYSLALNAYAGQFDKLSQSIRSIEDGRFLDALSRDEVREDEDWIIRLRALPDAPETYYLVELLASNDFQTGLENYLDLLDLRRRLSDWSTRVASHEETLDSLSGRIEETIDRVEDLMARQGRLLEKMATDELTARLRRLDVYASKARFGLADSKDRVQREERQ